ncbi:dTDP-4-dehydrorhamnose 3,5-epimerase family protein [Serratia marcescens]|uniref:dTDP-4-dehydrorhamnose 3,5-epimerase family protein n=1 Tax=Serratia marcescens TaxID=615 RepID=UPI00094977F9|nr:dTDP-4-dehydrorhamnose 3,5-epimerase family protein [Serratia marcescens]
MLGDARSSCLITFEKKGDHRGLGLELDFVQDNCFFSSKKLRGPPFQAAICQGQLVCVIRGEVFHVVVGFVKTRRAMVLGRASCFSTRTRLNSGARQVW